MVYVRPLFEETHAVRPIVLALCLTAHALLKLFFFSSIFQVHVAGKVFVMSQGLLTPVLLAGLVEWAVLVMIVMGVLGGLRARDLGLERGLAYSAILIFIVLWGVLQGVTAAIGGFANGEIALQSSNIRLLPLERIGLQLQAVFGSGLIEEVLYRGFLLTQVYLIAVGRQVNARAALMLAAGVSTLYFGINHIPAGMRMGLDMQGLMMYVGHVSLVGLLFATLYLRTGNLFVAAGAHALINQPMALFAAPVDPALIVLVGVACLLLSWPTLNRRIGLVFTIGAVEGRPAI